MREPNQDSSTTARSSTDGCVSRWLRAPATKIPKPRRDSAGGFRRSGRVREPRADRRADVRRAGRRGRAGDLSRRSCPQRPPATPPPVRGPAPRPPRYSIGACSFGEVLRIEAPPPRRGSGALEDPSGGPPWRPVAADVEADMARRALRIGRLVVRGLCGSTALISVLPLGCGFCARHAGRAAGPASLQLRHGNLGRRDTRHGGQGSWPLPDRRPSEAMLARSRRLLRTLDAGRAPLAAPVPSRDPPASPVQRIHLMIYPAVWLSRLHIENASILVRAKNPLIWEACCSFPLFLSQWKSCTQSISAEAGLELPGLR
jgi:hypothetical protein